ncbi:hypothetical protein FE257_007136 [Aspergillus nanangensis]|uniref:Secreted protein n=1 Tax=Aspergillus nanangensis TaxID=2582783 RepID=A0AAD4CNS2_ASPNN|nr:hypothetical protein FE257_007136 [Aspergillus nanangensis]
MKLIQASSPLAQYAILLLSMSPLGSFAICNDGEVGIGTNQLCQIGTPESGSQCSGEQGTIFDNGCHYIATGAESGYCSGDWPSGYDVRCNDDGYTPNYVVTIGGDFGNCYALSAGSCDLATCQAVDSNAAVNLGEESVVVSVLK